MVLPARFLHLEQSILGTHDKRLTSQDPHTFADLFSAFSSSSSSRDRDSWSRRSWTIASLPPPPSSIGHRFFLFPPFLKLWRGKGTLVFLLFFRSHSYSAHSLETKHFVDLISILPTLPPSLFPCFWSNRSEIWGRSLRSIATLWISTNQASHTNPRWFSILPLIRPFCWFSVTLNHQRESQQFLVSQICDLNTSIPFHYMSAFLIINACSRISLIWFAASIISRTCLFLSHGNQQPRFGLLLFFSGF